MEHGNNSTDRLRNPFGDRYHSASLAKLRFSKEDAENMVKWIKGKKDFLVFTGTPGCGKTYFAAAVWNHNQEHKIFNTVRAYREHDLLGKIRTMMNNGRDYLEDAKELCDDELIIIDDLGSTGVNEWRNEVYFTIIDYRSSSRKPTIITTNLNKDKLSVDVGMRIYSRLMDRENTFIEMQSTDLRQHGL
jgi:DNA replication protein DnaC